MASTRVVSIVPAVPYDDRPEWDVAVEDSADPDFYVEGSRWSDYGDAVREAEDFAIEYDAEVRR